MKVATYFPYSELNDGKPSTLEEFQTALGAFARSRILHLCSVMNALLRSERETINRNAHDALVRTFFSPQLAELLLPKEGDVRFVFHRQQILFVAKTALLHSREDGLVPGPPEFKRLGRIFLMAGDHLPSLHEIPGPLDEKFAFFAAQFLPIQESSGIFRFEHKVARSYIMLSNSAPSLCGGEEPHWDIATAFEKITGVPLLTFQSLIFGSLVKFHKFDPEAYKADPRHYGLSRTWFASTKVSPDLIDRFFNLVSGTPEEFKDAYEKTNRGNSDFTPFRDRPLFRDGDFLFLIDFAFLAEKFETGPFWSVHNSLSDKPAKDSLHAFWGRAFEKYTCDILRSSAVQPTNVIHESPVFANKQKGQVCDAIIVCDRSAAFVELKGSTFSSIAKYGSDYKVLKAELDKKLVQETDGSAKAVRQLKRAIDLICNPDKPELIEGIDVTKIDYIYPVVVTRDDVGSSFGVNAFLRVRFEAEIQRKNKRKVITPLFCMNAEDLELLTAYLKDTAFTDLLEAHYRANRHHGKYLWNTYFTTDTNAILKKKGLRKPEILKGFWEKLSTAAAEHLGLKL